MSEIFDQLRTEDDKLINDWDRVAFKVERALAERDQKIAALRALIGRAANMMALTAPYCPQGRKIADDFADELAVTATDPKLVTPGWKY